MFLMIICIFVFFLFIRLVIALEKEFYSINWTMKSEKNEFCNKL